ncbi:MAG: T9SS type A sorting domain-containing protein, partial [Flavobacteriales bacterium]|nr:T9SS type A sorting domain-containing protein [Flavobacteriales bacterium]
ASCNDGIQNQGETGVDCGGPCAACPTCNDGIQNQGETGVDCGGPCAPCGGGGGCSYVTVNSTSFNSWGIWNDGGSDCRRSSNDANYAFSPNYCVRLRDNSGSSHTTTDNLNLSAYDELTVEFYFRPRSMENGEDFWLQISTNGGSSYTTVAAYASGSSFNNNNFYVDDVVIPGPFSSNTRIRFRCDASTNSDYIYIDDVTITGCLNGARQDGSLETAQPNPLLDVVDVVSNVNLFPNPTSDDLNVVFNLTENSGVSIDVRDMQGRIVQSEQLQLQAGIHQQVVNTNSMAPGTYIMTLTSDVNRVSKRFVVYR